MKTDIISRMEANQARFRNCPICGNERRLYPEGYECAHCNSKPKFDAQAEHENDLRHESIMDDESEYGPVCNERDDEGWRQ